MAVGSSIIDGTDGQSSNYIPHWINGTGGESSNDIPHWIDVTDWTQIPPRFFFQRVRYWTTTQYRNYIFILFIICGGLCIVSYFPLIEFYNPYFSIHIWTLVGQNVNIKNIEFLLRLICTFITSRDRVLENFHPLGYFLTPCPSKKVDFQRPDL